MKSTSCTNHPLGKFIAQLQLSEGLKIDRGDMQLLQNYQFYLLAPPNQLKKNGLKFQHDFLPTAWAKSPINGKQLSKRKSLKAQVNIEKWKENNYFGKLVHEYCILWSLLLKDNLVKMQGKALVDSNLNIKTDKIPVIVEVQFTKLAFERQKFLILSKWKADQDRDLFPLIQSHLALLCAFQLFMMKTEKLAINNNFWSLCCQFFVHTYIDFGNQSTYFYIVAQDQRYYIDIFENEGPKQNIFWRNTKDSQKFILFEKNDGQFVSLQQVRSKFDMGILQKASDASLKDMIEQIDSNIQLIENGELFSMLLMIQEEAIKANELQNLLKQTLKDQNLKKAAQTDSDTFNLIIKLNQMINPHSTQLFQEQSEMENIVDQAQHYLRLLKKIGDNLYPNESQMTKRIKFEFPQTCQPTNIKTCLTPYQNNALSFMLYREGKLGVIFKQEEDEIIQSYSYYQKVLLPSKGEVYINTLTGQIHKSFPLQDTILGGVLGGQPGSGKTLSILALISFDNEKRPKDVCQKYYAHPTLVVANKQHVKKWIYQIKSHVKSGLIYSLAQDYDSNAEQMVDIVLITYDQFMLASQKKETSDSDSFYDDDGEFIPKKRQLKRKTPNIETKNYCFVFQEWYRIVLDEPQLFGNDLYFASKLSGLRSKYRWCLSAQPYQHQIETFRLIIKFLNIQPLSHDFWFKTHFYYELTQKRILLNQYLMPYYFNHKSTSNIQEKSIIKYQLNEQEFGTYCLIQSKNKELFQSPQYFHANFLLNKYLELACQHPYLIYKKFGTFDQIAQKNFCLSIENHIDSFSNPLTKSIFVKNQVEQLKTKKTIICSLCSENKNNLVMALCGHYVCSSCSNNIMHIEVFKCPFCTRVFNKNTLFFYGQQQEEYLHHLKLSSKQKAIFKYLKVLELNHQNDKVLIACTCIYFQNIQARKIMEMNAYQLRHLKIKNFLIRKKAGKRELSQVCQEFQEAQGFTVIQINIKIQTNHLCLQDIQHVFIFDCFWTIKNEYELISLISKQNQKQKLKFYKLEAKNTIEEQMNQNQIEQYQNLIYL